MNKFFVALIILFLVSACQSAKDAFTLKKKSSADEFLVEKKSPLVLPPNYGDLPLPTDEKSDEKKDINEDVALSDDNLKINKTVKNSDPTLLEKSVLEKMK
tara:strand:- start:248 stop:550 length:303 start_codon:yes stop_codon:yes gene_type:complete